MCARDSVRETQAQTIMTDVQDKQDKHDSTRSKSDITTDMNNMRMCV
jgi:hypothetical protein